MLHIVVGISVIVLAYPSRIFREQEAGRSIQVAKVNTAVGRHVERVAPRVAERELQPAAMRRRSLNVSLLLFETAALVYWLIMLKRGSG